MFWVTKVVEYGMKKLNFRVQIDWSLSLLIIKREKKKIIYICELAVDTVFEVGFIATY